MTRSLERMHWLKTAVAALGAAALPRFGMAADMSLAREAPKLIG